MGFGKTCRRFVVGGSQIAQAGVAQGAAAGGFGIGIEIARTSIK